MSWHFGMPFDLLYLPNRLKVGDWGWEWGERAGEGGRGLKGREGTRQGSDLQQSRTCGVCVTEGGVQEDVSQAAAPDVDRFVGNVSEDDPIGVHPALDSLLSNHGLPIRREA